MGTWGPGVYQNDHALDLLSDEVMHLIDELEKTLAVEPLSYDDLEGPLIYVHLLSLIAHERPELDRLNRAIVEGWKQRHLDSFDTDPDYLAERREVIVREFDTLIARLSEKWTGSGSLD